MKITFAICTLLDRRAELRLEEIFQSIQNLNIPHFEILVEGPIPAITLSQKKNKLIETAMYPNIVLMHDYYVFDKDWYKNFVEFGEDWDVCSCQQLLINRNRHFTDWVVWDHPSFPQYYSLDYNDWSITKYMYQSGGFMLLKKDFGLTIPFNPKLDWGEGEDLEWSLRMRDHAVWKCNGNSIVRHNKVHRDAR